MEEKKKRRRFGDRKDGTLLRDLDGMHFVIPRIFPNRSDNEAFITECVELAAVNAYLEKKNADSPEFKYTLFHVIVAAILKCLYLRPKMNRFIANKNMYQRNEVTASFVIKKYFADEAREGLAVVHAKEDDTLDTIHEDIRRQVMDCRGGKTDKSSDELDIFNKMPRFISKFAIWVITKLDVRGKVPASMIATDPYYASVLLSNLGSIKLKSGYHHLANWGTNSVFVTVGEKKIRPFFEPDGSVRMADSVDIGMTIDERIADGYYYSKTVKLFKHIMEHPELLDEPLSKPLEEM